MENAENEVGMEYPAPVRSEADTWGMGDHLDAGQVQLPPLLTTEELAALEARTLVAHCANLQRACVQLLGDNKVLSWELSESNDYLLRFARVAQIAHYLNASDLDNVANFAISELPQYLNCGFAAFYLYDQARNEFTLYHATHPVDDAHVVSRDGGHFLVRLFRHRDDPFLIEYERGVYRVDASNSFAAPEQWHLLLGDTAMVFPLLISGQGDKPLILGGLIIGNSAGRLTEKDAEVSLMFVDLLSSSLHNANLVRQLNRMATTDVLTGLYNRRHFLVELEKAIAHALRTGQPLSLSMLDIDHFKKINDAHGHLCGDGVLKEIGDILAESVRKNVDTPARYGGEEFVVIMPYTRIDQALTVNERIRRAVEEKNILCDGQGARVTCSIGIAEYMPGENYNHFIDRADDALYRAKESGRNQICVLTADLPGEGRK